MTAYTEGWRHRSSFINSFTWRKCLYKKNMWEFSTDYCYCIAGDTWCISNDSWCVWYGPWRTAVVDDVAYLAAMNLVTLTGTFWMVLTWYPRARSIDLAMSWQLTWQEMSSLLMGLYMLTWHLDRPSDVAPYVATFDSVTQSEFAGFDPCSWIGSSQIMVRLDLSPWVWLVCTDHGWPNPNAYGLARIVQIRLARYALVRRGGICPRQTSHARLRTIYNTYIQRDFGGAWSFFGLFFL